MRKVYPKSELYSGDHVALIRDAFIFNSIVEDLAGDAPSKDELDLAVYAWTDAYNAYDKNAIQNAVECTVPHIVKIGKRIA